MTINPEPFCVLVLIVTVSHRTPAAVETLGLKPRPNWIHEEFQDGAGVSNIVFSNGLLDPWSSGGVTTDLSESVIAVVIPEGAHHLDLMFSQGPLDPVRPARRPSKTPTFLFGPRGLPGLVCWACWSVSVCPLRAT